MASLETDATIHRLSVDDVFAMVAAGILTEDDRVELVEGVLYDLSPIGPDHGWVLAMLTKHFVRSVDEPHQVRIQDMLYTADGFRLPDLEVVRPRDRKDRVSTALLVIEVADTSLGYDQRKAATYARQGVPEYWIVDVNADEITVMRDPHDIGYTQTTTHRDGTLTPPVGAPLDVREIFAD